MVKKIRESKGLWVPVSVPNEKRRLCGRAARAQECERKSKLNVGFRAKRAGV